MKIAFSLGRSITTLSNELVSKTAPLPILDLAFDNQTRAFVSALTVWVWVKTIPIPFRTFSSPKCTGLGFRRPNVYTSTISSVKSLLDTSLYEKSSGVMSFQISHIVFVNNSSSLFPSMSLAYGPSHAFKIWRPIFARTLRALDFVSEQLRRLTFEATVFEMQIRITNSGVVRTGPRLRAKRSGTFAARDLSIMSRHSVKSIGTEPSINKPVKCVRSNNGFPP